MCTFSYIHHPQCKLIVVSSSIFQQKFPLNFLLGWAVSAQNEGLKRREQQPQSAFSLSRLAEADRAGRSTSVPRVALLGLKLPLLELATAQAGSWINTSSAQGYLRNLKRRFLRGWLCSTSSKRGQRTWWQREPAWGWSLTRSWWGWGRGSRRAAAAAAWQAGLLLDQQSRRGEEEGGEVKVGETSIWPELILGLWWSRPWVRRWPESSRREASGCTGCQEASSFYVWFTWNWICVFFNPLQDPRDQKNLPEIYPVIVIQNHIFI